MGGSAPIGSGIAILLSLGAAYGGRKVYKAWKTARSWKNRYHPNSFGLIRPRDESADYFQKNAFDSVRGRFIRYCAFVHTFDIQYSIFKIQNSIFKIT